jgi:hypothetical protein
MKILIMVMSCEVDRYPELVQCQKETWDSIDHPDTTTIYFYASEEDSKIGNRWNIPVKEGYGSFHLKTITAFQRALELPDWDYIFKTDNSAYVHKEQLVRALKDKHRTKFYGGHVYPHKMALMRLADPFMWGEGFAVSRDVAEHLVQEFNLTTQKCVGVEDVCIGMTLNHKCVWDGTMLLHDYWKDQEIPTDKHLYRCKNDGGDPERSFDDTIQAMKLIHNHLINNGKTNNSQ